MAFVTRADTFTNVKKKIEIYSDFLDNLDQTPFGGDLARFTNEKSVTQSIRHLISTNVGERLFQPSVGCGVNAAFNELTGIPLENYLIGAITDTITKFERRAVLDNVVVSDMSNSVDYQQPAAVDRNTVSVTITYYLINNPIPVVFSMMLYRLR